MSDLSKACSALATRVKELKGHPSFDRQVPAILEELAKNQASLAAKVTKLEAAGRRRS